MTSEREKADLSKRVTDAFNKCVNLTQWGAIASYMRKVNWQWGKLCRPPTADELTKQMREMFEQLREGYLIKADKHPYRFYYRGGLLVAICEPPPSLAPNLDAMYVIVSFGHMTMGGKELESMNGDMTGSWDENLSIQIQHKKPFWSATWFVEPMRAINTKPLGAPRKA